MPVELHAELHRSMGVVSVPPKEEVDRLWRERRLLGHDLGMREAFIWLLSSAEDEEFLKGIAKQYVFLATRRFF